MVHLLEIVFRPILEIFFFLVGKALGAADSGPDHGPGVGKDRVDWIRAFFFLAGALVLFVLVLWVLSVVQDLGWWSFSGS